MATKQFSGTWGQEQDSTCWVAIVASQQMVIFEIEMQANISYVVLT